MCSTGRPPGPAIARWARSSCSALSPHPRRAAAVPPPTDYRPVLQLPADLVFVVPDRTPAHPGHAQWKGIEQRRRAATHPKTRAGIVQYGKDGTRGIVQAMTFDQEVARASFRSSLLRETMVLVLMNVPSGGRSTRRLTQPAF